MLSVTTQIPTSARIAVRSLVKGHAGWKAYRTAKGLLSANASNAEIIEYALQHADLTAKIEAILGATPVAPQQTDDETMTPEDIAQYDREEERDRLEDTAPIPAAFDLDAILSGVDQLLSPLVRKEIAGALSPVIDAANRGPVEIEKIVEVERIVEVAQGEGPRVAALPRARRGKKTTFRTLFPSRAKDAWRDNALTIWEGANTPSVDPFYVVNHWQMSVLMSAIERGVNSWLAGPPGTGKSTMPRQAAAWLGRPFIKIGMTRHTEVESLVGGMGLRNGNTVWEDGILTKAMRTPGMVILIDELTIAPEGVQAIFQQVCDDHRSLELQATGEVVRAADGVVFIVADNTTGSGDATGLFAGTNVSNAALVTRYQRMLIIDYLSVDKEAEALANHTRCPMPAATHLAEFVAMARRMPALQGVIISLRQMTGFVQCIQDGYPSKDAFEIAISSRMPATERATIEALADLSWSSTFDALMAGKAAPVQPSDSAAAKAFPDQF